MEAELRLKTRPIPIRLDAATTRRIDRAIRSIGITRSAFIRMALLIQLPAIEAGKIIFDPQCEQKS